MSEKEMTERTKRGNCEKQKRIRNLIMLIAVSRHESQNKKTSSWTRVFPLSLSFSLSLSSTLHCSKRRTISATIARLPEVSSVSPDLALAPRRCCFLMSARDLRWNDQPDHISHSSAHHIEKTNILSSLQQIGNDEYSGDQQQEVIHRVMW